MINHNSYSCSIAWRATVAALCALLLGIASCASGLSVIRTDTGEVEVIRPVILTTSARLPESDPSFLGVEVTEDHLLFSYSHPPATPIEPGQVLGGAGDGGYVRRVLEVGRAGDGRIDVKTEPAYLTDLIADGAFRVDIEPDADDWEETPGAARSAIKASRELLPDTFGESLTCGGGAKVSLQLQPHLAPAVHLHTDIDIRPTSGWVFGELQSARITLEGEIEVGWEQTISEPMSLECTLDLVKLWEAKGAPLPSLSFVIQVPVGPILIPVKHTIRPIAKLRDRIVATTYTKDRWSLRLGLSMGGRYENGAWEPVFEPRRSWDIDTETGGELDIGVSFTSGVALESRVLGLVGPTFGLEYTIGGEVVAGGGACHWTLEDAIRLTAALDLEARLPLGFHLSVAAWDMTIELAKTRLASGPCGGCVDEEEPFWDEDLLECTACPAATPVWNPTLEACSAHCDAGLQSGDEHPVIRAFEMGKKSGTFTLSWDMQEVKDRIVVEHEGLTIADTGCTQFGGSLAVDYAGSSTSILVRVMPNCAGDPNTQWSFQVSCP